MWKIWILYSLRKKIRKTQWVNQNAKPRSNVAGTWYSLLEPSSGMPHHILDLEVHGISTQEILQESKNPFISAMGWSPVLQAIMQPSMSFNVPWAQAGNQDTMGLGWLCVRKLFHNSWGHWSLCFQKTTVLNHSMQSSLPRASRAAAILLLISLRLVVKHPTYVMHIRWELFQPGKILQRTWVCWTLSHSLTGPLSVQRSEWRW